jgi:hypothetical protein
MGPRSFVIAPIGVQHVAQPRFVEDQHVVEAFPSDGARRQLLLPASGVGLRRRIDMRNVLDAGSTVSTRIRVGQAIHDGLG